MPFIDDPRDDERETSEAVDDTASDVVGFVHSTESGGAVDGPGVRFVLFLSGCALRCSYCHNPDTWHKHRGTRTTASAVISEISSYAAFLRRAGGGVTLSGGEPLVQASFVGRILAGAKRLGLHTALDTSGFLARNASDALLADTDLVLLDIKAFSEATYRDLTGVSLQPTLDFALRLARMKKPVWLRYVLVPGVTDDIDEIRALACFARDLGVVERVEILPFHKMGEYKWEDCGVDYKLAATSPPTQDAIACVRDVFRDHGLVAH